MAFSREEPVVELGRFPLHPEEEATQQARRIVFPSKRWAENPDWDGLRRARSKVLSQLTAGKVIVDADIIAAMDEPTPQESQTAAEQSFMAVIADPEQRKRLAAFDLTRQVGMFMSSRGLELDEYDSRLLANIVGAGLSHEDMLAGWSEAGTFPQNTWPVEVWWTHYMDMENTDPDEWAIAHEQGEVDGV